MTGLLSKPKWLSIPVTSPVQRQVQWDGSQQVLRFIRSGKFPPVDGRASDSKRAVKRIWPDSIDLVSTCLGTGLACVRDDLACVRDDSDKGFFVLFGSVKAYCCIALPRGTCPLWGTWEQPTQHNNPGIAGYVKHLFGRSHLGIATSRCEISNLEPVSGNKAFFLEKYIIYIYIGYGSIPIDTFLVGWTSIYQLFWGSLGTRVLTHPHIYTHMYIYIYRGFLKWGYPQIIHIRHFLINIIKLNHTKPMVNLWFRGSPRSRSPLTSSSWFNI